MEYIWKDYYDCIIDEEIFLDKEAKELTGMDEEGINRFCDYWNQKGKLNKDHWYKMIYLNNVAIGFIAIGKDNKKYIIMEFIINKYYRSKGYGNRILKELINNSNEIINEKIENIEAVIFFRNIASQKCFEKAGFMKELHPEGDCYIYRYKTQ